MNTLKQIGMGLVLISTLAMTGCSDLDDPDDSNTSGGGKTNTTQTGIFVDAPVMGLHYKTDTQDGYTDEKGTFKYENGERVEFFLGDLSLGKVEAGAMITPYTLAGVEGKSDLIKSASNRATNIALLLQNLDFQRDDHTILDLTKFKDHKFTKQIKLYEDSNTTKNNIKALMNGEAKDKIATGAQVMTPDDVKTHMETGVKTMEDAHKKDDKLSDMYGKTYVVLNCTDTGCKEDGDKLSINAGTLTKTTAGSSFAIPYTDEGNSTIKISGDTELFYIFSDTSKKIVISCNGATLNEAKTCSKKQKLVLDSIKEKYMEMKDKYKKEDKKKKEQEQGTKQDHEELSSDNISQMYGKKYTQRCTTGNCVSVSFANGSYTLTHGTVVETVTYNLVKGKTTTIKTNQANKPYKFFIDTGAKDVKMCEIDTDDSSKCDNFALWDLQEN
jgi:hypothetical protein